VRFLGLFVKLALQTNKKIGFEEPAVGALMLLTVNPNKKSENNYTVEADL
jgi:hypothetical protein